MISGRILRTGIASLAVGLLLLTFAGCAANPLEYIPAHSSSSHSSAADEDLVKTDCTASNKNTVCTINLSNYKTSKDSVTWSVQSSAPPHATFNPTSGTLEPGQSQNITVTFAGRVCMPTTVTLLQTWNTTAANNQHAEPNIIEMQATGDGC